MKINYAVMGSNMDPTYIEFWPIVSKVWKLHFGITPVLGLITNEDTDFEEDEYGLVKKFKSIGNIDVALQSQIIRHWLSKELSGNIIITDIDILPMSKNYFIEQVKNFDENKFYIMSSINNETKINKEIPMCYNVANSKVYSEVLELENDWITFAERLSKMNYGWSTDQKYLWEKVSSRIEKNYGDIVFIERGNSYDEYRRIDRISWFYDENKVSEGYYIDSHLLRPYSQFEQEINKLIKLLLI